MNENRKTIEENNVHKVEGFAYSTYDDALIGSASRFDYTKPRAVYDFNTVLEIIEKYNKTDTSKETAITNFIKDGILLKVDSATGDFWDRVVEEKAVVWEHFNNCIEGAVICSNNPEVLLYNYYACMEVAFDLQEDSDKTEQENTREVIEWFDNNIINANVGPTTPYILSPIL